MHGTVSHDGYVVATWRFEREKRGRGEPGRTTLVVAQIDGLTARVRAAIEAEAQAYLAFHEPAGTDLHVRFRTSGD